MLLALLPITLLVCVGAQQWDDHDEIEIPWTNFRRYSLAGQHIPFGPTTATRRRKTKRKTKNTEETTPTWTRNYVTLPRPGDTPRPSTTTRTTTESSYEYYDEEDDVKTLVVTNSTDDSADMIIETASTSNPGNLMKWTVPGGDGANVVIDIETLVNLVANLTLDYELINITDLFNKTLLAYNMPVCLRGPTTTTSTTLTTTTEAPSTMDLVNATIISKCFVCGMETEGIPRNAWCADAFSGDFLPIVKVDPMARGQIATFRKYCRYLDVPGVLHNETQPRSVYGRFTGGCSVRWIDLSGVYTQRACRNRRHAVMGKHFVSKRMAKLEMALTKEDEGCLASPMASLVPLSRGISLYARFHACVCTGSWCNHAASPPRRRRVSAAPLLTWTLVLTLIIY